MSLVVPKKSPISTNCRIWTPWSMCLHSLWWQNNFFYDILLDTSFSVPTSPSSSEDTAWVHMHVGTRNFSNFVFSYIDSFRTHAWIQDESLVIFATCHRVVSFLSNINTKRAAINYVQLAWFVAPDKKKGLFQPHTKRALTDEIGYVSFKIVGSICTPHAYIMSMSKLWL